MTQEERARAEKALSKFRDSIEIKDHGLALIIMHQQIKYTQQQLDLLDIPVVSGSYVAFCDGADDGVDGLVQLSCTIDNEVDGKRYCENFKSRSPFLYRLVE